MDGQLARLQERLEQLAKRVDAAIQRIDGQACRSLEQQIADVRHDLQREVDGLRSEISALAR